MQIQIWSDLSCPFCVIGKRHLAEALALFAGQEQVELIYRSFELDPDTSAKAGGDLHQRLAAKYGRSMEAVKKMMANIAEQAKPLGFDFDFEHLIPANTFNAHRLLHFAAEYNQADVMENRLFKAYFTDGLNLEDINVLVQLAADTGFDSQLVYEFLISDDYTLAVRSDEQMAQKLQISGVPFFIFNNQYGLSGAQPVEAFTQILQKIQSAGSSSDSVEPKPDNAPNCADDSCTLS